MRNSTERLQSASKGFNGPSTTMTVDHNDLRVRISTHLAANPDQTSYQIAAAVGADHWAVQSEVIRMMLAGRLTQTVKREAFGPPSPTYRVATPETANG